MKLTAEELQKRIDVLVELREKFGPTPDLLFSKNLEDFCTYIEMENK